jgi:hypothetical protein
MRKRLDNFEKMGYHIIKRNMSEHNIRQTLNDDLHDEVSDDSANASRIEATLDALYSETRSI